MESIKKYIYLVWVLIISNLHYQEYFGLNALLVACFTVPVFGLMNKTNLTKAKWWFAGGLYIASGISVFIQGAGFPVFLYFISAMLFVAIQLNLKHSLFIGVLQTLMSWGAGLYHYFNDLFTITNKENSNHQKVVKNILLVAVPLLIAIIFLKLYQSADETFAEYTAWINLDWISWGFIGFYILMTILLYGLFYAKAEPSLAAWEDVLKNKIPTDYDDGIQRVVGIKNETKTAVALLIILNAFLLLYNFIDVNFVATKLFNHNFDSSYSQVVHGGINSLIGSIVLVILLLTYMFRGQLNFKSSAALKILATIWLLQNIVMISTTSIKNWEYVAHWGLTYKRIGVFVYLLLAVVGISFTLYKLFKAKSIWYLVRSTSLSFLAFFIVFSSFSWDRIIAEFNLNTIATERVDFDYLLDLGDNALPSLIFYQRDESMDEIYYEQLYEKASYARETLKDQTEATSWRSLNLADQRVLKVLTAWPHAYSDYERDRTSYSQRY